jgi:hypothetical protein
MNMVNLGYVIATALIAMVVVKRGYPLVRRLRAEGKFSVGRARRAATQGSNV